jgi:cob(I)alamin adenosyltransferase
MTASTTPPSDAPQRATKRATSLFLVNTGEGNGKSTAAFGTALRAAGAGLRVCVIQFMKSGKWKTGEEKAGRDLGIEWWTLGDGFTWESTDMERTEAIAREAWAAATEKIRSGEFDLIVLDEVTYPITWGWIDESQAIDVIKSRPPNVNIIATGRGATASVIQAADTVTEMVKRKHVFDSGVKALRGIDF